MPEPVSSDISQAIFETVLYSDVFDFPLTALEIYRYLSVRAVTEKDICDALDSDLRVTKAGQYYTLIGREEIVQLRETRELNARKLFPYALAYGRIIGSLPFVRMVALTGSLAVHNVSKEEDFDYMLVTLPGRLWTARAFVLLFNRLTRLADHTLCPNIIVTENSLEWGQHDLYSARDLCQMVPIAGMSVYQRLMQANRWVRDFLPNAYEEIIGQPKSEEKNRFRMIQRMFEVLLHSRLGDRFERWEMNRKIKRFSSQAGFGEETIFTADICQGNFDNHRQWTQQQLRKRGRTFELEASFHRGKMI